MAKRKKRNERYNLPLANPVVLEQTPNGTYVTYDEIMRIKKESFNNGRLQGIQDSINSTLGRLNSERIAGEDFGFDEGQNWSNAINVVCFMKAIQNVFGAGRDRGQRVLFEVNKLIEELNKGEKHVEEWMNEIEKKFKVEFDDECRDTVRNYKLVKKERGRNAENVCEFEKQRNIS